MASWIGLARRRSSLRETRQSGRVIGRSPFTLPPSNSLSFIPTSQPVHSHDLTRQTDRSTLANATASSSVWMRWGESS